VRNPGYWLGNEYPVGSVLLSRWKEKFPHVVRTILVSGSDLENHEYPAGVDAVFGKPADMQAIRNALMIR
jgi:hypothetical protein